MIRQNYLDNEIELYHRAIREKEELVELKYFTKYPKFEVKTIKDKIKYDKRLERIKLKEFKIIEKKFKLNNYI